MHIYKAPGGTRFSYNPDFSGGIAILAPGATVYWWVSAEDLIRFFVECWLTPKITRWIGTFIDDLGDIMRADWG